MKPTPAQIEAAVKALKDAAVDSYRDAAIVVLTAAAEVSKQAPFNVYNSVYQEAIERCAQVAETMSSYYGNVGCASIAAAIRALKEET